MERIGIHIVAKLLIAAVATVPASGVHLETRLADPIEDPGQGIVSIQRTATPVGAHPAGNAGAPTAGREDRGVLSVRSLHACTGAGDDSQVLQQALDTGRPIDLEDGTCRLSNPLRVTHSGQWLFGRGATLTTAGPSTAAIIVGAAADGSFVKTDDVTIEGIAFDGQADGVQGPPTAASVVVRGPPPNDKHSGSADDRHTSVYMEGAGCSGVTIRSIRERGFVFGIIATGADRITVEDSSFGGNFYFATAGAGGYGVLLQACTRVTIANNSFTATPTDRHSIYVSADPSRVSSNGNICHQVIIRGNTIDWGRAIDGSQCRTVQRPQCPVVDRPTHYEVAIMVRAAEDLVIADNTILGGYGGIYYDAQNGSGSRVSIVGNTLSGQAASEAGERAGIEFRNLAPANPNITTGIVITGNVLGPFSSGETRSRGISLHAVNGVTLTGNSILSNGISTVRLGGDTTNVIIGGNTLDARGSYVYEFSGERNGVITINKNQEDVERTRLYRFRSTPGKLAFGYTRCAEFRLDKSRRSVAYDDPHGIIAHVSRENSGFRVVFSPAVSGSFSAADLSFTTTGPAVTLVPKDGGDGVGGDRLFARLGAVGPASELDSTSLCVAE